MEKKYPLFIQTWIENRGSTPVIGDWNDDIARKWFKRTVNEWNKQYVTEDHFQKYEVKCDIPQYQSYRIIGIVQKLSDKREDFNRAFPEIRAILLDDQIAASNKDILEKLKLLQIEKFAAGEISPYLILNIKQKESTQPTYQFVHKSRKSSYIKIAVAILVLALIGLWHWYWTVTRKPDIVCNYYDAIVPNPPEFHLYLNDSTKSSNEDDKQNLYVIKLDKRWTIKFSLDSHYELDLDKYAKIERYKNHYKYLNKNGNKEIKLSFKKKKYKLNIGLQEKDKDGYSIAKFKELKNKLDRLFSQKVKEKYEYQSAVPINIDEINKISSIYELDHIILNDKEKTKSININKTKKQEVVQILILNDTSIKFVFRKTEQYKRLIKYLENWKKLCTEWKQLYKTKDQLNKESDKDNYWSKVTKLWDKLKKEANDIEFIKIIDEYPDQQIKEMNEIKKIYISLESITKVSQENNEWEKIKQLEEIYKGIKNKKTNVLNIVYKMIFDIDSQKIIKFIKENAKQENKNKNGINYFCKYQKLKNDSFTEENIKKEANFFSVKKLNKNSYRIEIGIGIGIGEIVLNKIDNKKEISISFKNSNNIITFIHTFFNDEIKIVYTESKKNSKPILAKIKKPIHDSTFKSLLIEISDILLCPK